MKTKKQKIKEECWNLDYNLISWLNIHLRVFYEDADKFVVLNKTTFKVKNKIYTLDKALERLIKITDYFLDNRNYYITNDCDINMKNEMYDILKSAHFYLWW